MLEHELAALTQSFESRGAILPVAVAANAARLHAPLRSVQDEQYNRTKGEIRRLQAFERIVLRFEVLEAMRSQIRWVKQSSLDQVCVCAIYWSISDQGRDILFDD